MTLNSLVKSALTDGMETGKQMLNTKLGDMIPLNHSLSTVLTSFFLAAIALRFFLKILITIMPFGGPRRSLSRLSLRIFGLP